MATHSRVLAWRIPGTGEPAGLPCGVAQSRIHLKRLSSSSSSMSQVHTLITESQRVKMLGFNVSKNAQATRNL